MNTTRTHTQGALRAARQWIAPRKGSFDDADRVGCLAALIDEETHATELLAVVERFARYCEQNSAPELQGIACEAFAALAKAKGVQS